MLALKTCSSGCFSAGAIAYVKDLSHARRNELLDDNTFSSDFVSSIYDNSI